MQVSQGTQCGDGTLHEPDGEEKGKAKVETDSCVSTNTRRRPNILPNKFNGKTPWREYKQHIAACKLANRWTNKEAKVFLAASLQREAVKILGNLVTSESHL